MIETQNLLDTFAKNLAASKGLSFPTELWDFIVDQMLIKRLDKMRLQKFDLFHDSIELPTYMPFNNFVDK